MPVDDRESVRFARPESLPVIVWDVGRAVEITKFRVERNLKYCLNPILKIILKWRNAITFIG